MATNVVMPQMGESVAEGTVTRWVKKVGDSVDRDEPLFEISTDKVDAEIPSPTAGVVLEIKVQEGETVPVDTVVAVIGAAGERPAAASPVAAPAPQPPASKPQPDGAPAVENVAAVATVQQPLADADADAQAAPSSPAAARTSTRGSSGESVSETDDAVEADQEAGTDAPADAQSRLRRQKSSPLVRRIAKEHKVDIARLTGSGLNGRVTKQDILQYIEAHPRGSAAPEPAAVAAPPPRTDGISVVPMTVMRRKIAEHMIASQRTSAHVYSVVEVDYSRVASIRAAKKAEYEQAGAKLTFMAFLVKASVDALRAMPVVNASIDGDTIVYKRDVNIGIAVALDWGLIVPVIKGADEKNLLGLSRAIGDVATRARAKQLKPDEVHGGTFTITNPGSLGTLLGLPIINQPQVAILGVGAIEKRVAVIDDAIAIRQRGYLTLGYDHRLIDGSVADEFLSRIKKGIERFDAAGA